MEEGKLVWLHVSSSGECLLREEFENCENLGIIRTFSLLSCCSHPTNADLLAPARENL